MLRKSISYFLMLVTILLQSQNTEAYEQLLNNYYVSGPGYSVIVTKGGETIYHDAIGLADVENNIDLKNNHVFRIGSITKQFTAIAILQLMEQGKLKLDDDISMYIADYPTDGRKICIKHLLNHTSGIKNYMSLKTNDQEQRKQDVHPMEIIELFKNEPVDFDPGDQFRYNNSGYILLGYIIETLTGRSYEDYIEEEFFEYLEMNDSYYGRASEIISNRANGYEPDFTGEIMNAPYLSMTQPYAAGSLIMTTADLSKWNEAVFNCVLVSEESLNLALTPTVLNNRKEVQYGLGWRFNRLKGSIAYNHGGGISGFASHAAYFPEEDVYVAVLSNCSSSEPSYLMRLLAAEALGISIRPDLNVQVDQDVLNSYAGSYFIESSGETINISTTKGRLYAQGTRQSILPLTAIEEDRFKAPQIEAEIRFIRKDGNIESLMFFQKGEYIAKKVN